MNNPSRFRHAFARCETDGFNSQLNANLISGALTPLPSCIKSCMGARVCRVRMCMCVTGYHRGISRYYSNIKYPLFTRGRGASGVTAVGVYLNLITEQNIPALTEIRLLYGGQKKKEKKKKK